MRVKICGITRLADAFMAAELGATALGFNFVPSSPRRIRPETAGAIVRQIPPFVPTVGVLANVSREEVLYVLRTSRVSVLQFHGSERPEDLRGYPVPVYKAFRVSANFNPASLGNYPGPAYLLDTHADDQIGGTGKTFDWDVAVQAREYGKIILAGGLNPDNVGDAIRKVRPFAIDIASGVEEAPGKKSHEAMRLLFARIREAEGEAA